MMRNLQFVLRPYKFGLPQNNVFSAVLSVTLVIS